MNAISLINSGVAWFAAAAVLAFLFSFHHPEDFCIQKKPPGFLKNVSAFQGKDFGLFIKRIRRFFRPESCGH